MEFFDSQRQALHEILRWRRDVRHFRRDPLPEDDLEQLRHAMDLAPSVGNARPWRVFRVQDPEVMTQARDIFQRCNEAAGDDYEGDRRAAYMKLKLAGMEDAPVQLAVFTETDPEEGHGLGRATMADTLVQSTAMSIYSLMLTARAMNIGVGMVSILDPGAIETLFDVPPGWRFASWLCIGYPQTMDDTPLLHRVGWQENTTTSWSLK
ncbi:MAG: 5,6-dimethylbenzimidazole synthase [Pelagimonas sp.]|jgi:5,6-dimethylbenzimidazole synthase|nr:5,6-dimethylbenzimidazole synthase [Pelagimonas sp.]